jgi:hypothetical protein
VCPSARLVASCQYCSPELGQLGDAVSCCVMSFWQRGSSCINTRHLSGPGLLVYTGRHGSQATGQRHTVGSPNVWLTCDGRALLQGSRQEGRGGPQAHHNRLALPPCVRMRCLLLGSAKIPPGVPAVGCPPASPPPCMCCHTQEGLNRPHMDTGAVGAFEHANTHHLGH